MRQGSDATCCTTRRTDASPMLATNCAAPSWGPDAVRTQATPLLLVTVRTRLGLPATDKLKFTGVGVSTMFWFLSNTKATPMTTSGFDTGTRDGLAMRLIFSGF